MLPLVYCALRFPRWAVTLVALLWLCITLLMLVGVGEWGGVAGAGCHLGTHSVLLRRRRRLAAAPPSCVPRPAAVLRGAHTMASDACLFGESFALSYARKHTAGTLWGPSVRQAALRGGRTCTRPHAALPRPAARQQCAVAPQPRTPAPSLTHSHR